MDPSSLKGARQVGSMPRFVPPESPSLPTYRETIMTR